MLRSITVIVNGQSITREVDPNVKLLQFLREDLGLTGTKNGCGTGHCGTCTVLIDSEPKRACIMKLSQCENKAIQTIESLGNEDRLHPLQQAFIEEGAVQCGFCTPGMLMASKGLLDTNPHPSTQEIRFALRNNICRCTGYGAIIRAVKKAAIQMNGNYKEDLDESDFSGSSSKILRGESASFNTRIKVGLIGTNVIKKDAVPKATGGKVFAGDFTFDEMLHGKIRFSDYAHAKVISIDASKAMKMEGVIDIATYKDIPGLNKFGLFIAQQPVLAETEVRFFGDAVACVFAETEAVAAEAAKLIQIQYEPLEVLLNPEVNILEGSPLIHEDRHNNIIHHVSVRKGDLEDGFSKADVIIENVYETQAVEHAYLEPESCVATMMNNELVLYSGSQGSEAYRRMIAATLHMDIHKVRVVLTATGGGFGGKEEPTVQLLAALGTWMTQRPVKMVLSREESLRMSTKRHPMKMWMKHGITKNGDIVGFKSKVIADAGAYISQTNPVIFRSAVTASGPYYVENVEADSYGVYTHKNPSGAFRGFGSTQASFACESQLDQLAEAIGMSPYELRLKNAFKEGVVTSTGQVLKDGIGYIGTLNAVNDSMLKMKEVFMGVEREPHIKLGFGLGSAYKNVGIGTGKPDKAGAYVEILKSGRVLVSMGAADMGQGVDTIMAQIASTALEIPYALIDVIACDTKSCPDGGMTTASRQTFVTGNAVKEASEILHSLLKEYLLRDAKDEEASDINVAEVNAITADTKKSVGLSSIELYLMQNHLKNAYIKANQDNKELRVEHVYYPPKTVAHKTDANHKTGEDVSNYDIHYSYCFASAAVAVEVNTLTGDIKVLKVCAAQDVGKALHPKNIIGQIEGSVAMGVGYALSEEFVVDDVKMHHNSMKSLKLVGSLQMPEVESVIIEEEQVKGPYGAKGMGEVGLNPIAPAIANAIYDACGIRLKNLPMKPAMILEALNLK